MRAVVEGVQGAGGDEVLLATWALGEKEGDVGDLLGQDINGAINPDDLLIGVGKDGTADGRVFSPFSASLTPAATSSPAPRPLPAKPRSRPISIRRHRATCVLVLKTAIKSASKPTGPRAAFTSSSPHRTFSRA